MSLPEPATRAERPPMSKEPGTMAGHQAAPPAPPLNRMIAAVLALAGTLVSAYLLLYHLGLLGSLVCGLEGGCEAVQASRWAVFLGLPVPLWGVAGYLLILAVALAGVQSPLIQNRKVATALLGLGGGAFLFSIYLTALEAFVIHAWCRWCVVSAIIAAGIFIAVLFEWRRVFGKR
jgi:uncharacterized membrane protein